MRQTILTCVLLLASAVSVQAKVSAAKDVITPSGQPVELSAMFEGREDEPVEFSIGGKLIEGTTNRAGVAVLKMRAKVPPGIYPYSVRLTRKRRAKVANARVFVVDPALPLVVVDLDGALSNGKAKLAFWGKREEAFSGARRVLQALSKNHQIVYLSARGNQGKRPTPEFLLEKGLPAGPILFDAWALDQKILRNNRGVYQHLKLHRLLAQGFTVRLGIGDKDSDAFAFEKAQVPSYIFTDDEIPTPSVSFISYLQLEQRLVAEGVLVRGGLSSVILTQ